MDANKLKDIFDDAQWKLTKEMYGVPASKTREDYFALCYEQDGGIYTPTIDECIAAGIFTKRPEQLPALPSSPTPQEDADALLVDHEYRLTLLELGVN